MLGLLGGVVGGILFGLIGLNASGLLGSIIVAACGAVLLIWIVRMVRAGRGTI